MSLVRFIVLLALAAGWAPAGTPVERLSQPTGYVSDFANVVDSQSRSELEDFCTRVERELGVQLALVTVDSTDGREIRDYALDLFRRWGVGNKASNQGVLLLLAIKDRKSDIETGRGIEPYITDGFAGGTLRDMRPQLQAGNYGAALVTAAQSMAAQIAQGKGVTFSTGLPPPVAPVRQRRAVREQRGIPGPLIVFGIFFILWLFGRFGRGRGGMGRGGPGGNFGTGVISGMVIDELLRGGRRGGDWGGGGGFGGGGGDSGGGGGFGGFGGGDAGGGGASSSW